MSGNFHVYVWEGVISRLLLNRIGYFHLNTWENKSKQEFIFDLIWATWGSIKWVSSPLKGNAFQHSFKEE